MARKESAIVLCQKGGVAGTCKDKQKGSQKRKKTRPTKQTKAGRTWEDVRQVRRAWRRDSSSQSRFQESASPSVRERRHLLTVVNCSARGGERGSWPINRPRWKPKDGREKRNHYTIKSTGETALRQRKRHVTVCMLPKRSGGKPNELKFPSFWGSPKSPRPLKQSSRAGT